MKKRIMSALMALILCCTLFPASVISAADSAAGITYLVMGSAGLCGTEWSTDITGNDNNIMAPNGDGTYSKTYTNVPTGEYELKVAGNDGVSEPVLYGTFNGANIRVNVTASCDVTVTFDPATGMVTVEGTGIEGPVSGVVLQTINMKETSPGVWEEKRYPEVGNQISANITAIVNGESVSLGLPAGTEVEIGRYYELVKDSDDVLVNLETFSRVTFTLDMRGFNTSDYTGAVVRVDVDSDAERYPVWVNGLQFDSDTPIIYGDAGTATLSVDNGDYTLTLDNYLYAGPGYTDGFIRAAIYAGTDLNLVLNGSSSSSVITSGDSGKDSHGVYIDGVLTVSGTGSLAAKGGEGASSKGVFAREITLNSGSLSGTGGEVPCADHNNESVGIYAGGNITVNDGGKLTGAGSSGKVSRGVFSGGTINVMAGGTLTGTAATETASGDANGINATGDLNVKGSVIGSSTANADDGVYVSGVFASKITVETTGSVTATGAGTDNNPNCCGVNGNVVIRGGKVTATGTTSAFHTGYPSPDTSSFTSGKVWYGADEATANITGEGTPLSSAGEAYYKEKYVRIAEAAAAAAAVPYNVWVAGIQVDSNNKDNVLGDNDNTVTYDPDKNTLTLTNANIGNGYVPGLPFAGSDSGTDCGIAADTAEPFTLELVGKNTINVPVDITTYAIAATGPLSIEGGELELSGDGMIAAMGDLTVTGSTITDSSISVGLISPADLIVSNSCVEATGSVTVGGNITLDSKSHLSAREIIAMDTTEMNFDEKALVSIDGTNYVLANQMPPWGEAGPGAISVTFFDYLGSEHVSAEFMNDDYHSLACPDSCPIQTNAVEFHYFPPLGGDYPHSCSCGLTFYGISVNGKYVHSENAHDVLNDTSLSGDPGSVVYNPDTNTLTLTGANIGSASAGDAPFGVVNGIVSERSDGLTIVLVGDNTVNGVIGAVKPPSSPDETVASPCPLTFSGAGSLTVTSPDGATPPIFASTIDLGGRSVTQPAGGAVWEYTLGDGVTGSQITGQHIGLNADTPVSTVQLGALEFTGLEITTPPKKTEYSEGETIDLTGMVVEAVYGDDDYRVEVTNYISSLAGGFAGGPTVSYQNTGINISYSGKNANQPITVRDNLHYIHEPEAVLNLTNGISPEAIKAKLPETVKVDITKVDENGAKLTRDVPVNWNVSNLDYNPGITSSHQEFTVPGFIVLPEDMDNTKGVSREVSIKVSVGVRYLTSITLISEPARTVYTVGEALDLTGLVVDLNYNNGNVLEVPFENFEAYGIDTAPLKDGHIFSEVNWWNMIVKTDSGVESEVLFRIDANEHVHTLEYRYDNDTGHWQVCTSDTCPDGMKGRTDTVAHVYDSITGSCLCGFGHTHSYDENALTSDESGHWMECFDINCPVADKGRTTVEAHVFDDDNDPLCDCGYMRELHLHNLSGKFDESGHWQECGDEDCTDPDKVKTPVEAHVYDDDADTTCECGYVRTVTSGGGATEGPEQKPTAPNTGGSASAGQAPRSPDTGDAGLTGLWTALLSGTLCTTAALLYWKRKKTHAPKGMK